MWFLALNTNAVMRPLTAQGADIVTAGTRLFDHEDTIRAFRSALTPDTKAVVCTHVSNVFGYVLPIEEIAVLCRSRCIPLIVDAAQSAGHLPVSLRSLGADYIAMPGHKGLYGPQGTGVLLCGRVPAETLIEGGTGSLSRELFMPEFLPDRLEPGTANVPGIAGLAAGLAFVESIGLWEIRERESRLMECLQDGLSSVQGVQCFFGAPQGGVLSLLMDGFDCEMVAEHLAKQGIAVRAGLQCAPQAHRSAGTLELGTVLHQRLSF